VFCGFLQLFSIFIQKIFIPSRDFGYWHTLDWNSMRECQLCVHKLVDAGPVSVYFGTMNLWPQNGNRRSQLVKVRVTAEEKRHVMDVARALGITVSNYVRRLVFGSERGMVAGQEHAVVHDIALRARLDEERKHERQKGQSDEG
jgi:hypothetical protein